MMHEKDTTIKLLFKGDKALFTDPINRITGEKISYPVPTYAALQGLLRNVYSVPSIVWQIDECRVLNRIIYRGEAICNPYKGGKGDRVTYQYLHNVAYEVTAHYTWNYALTELSDDWSYGRHDRRIKAAIQEGGRMDLCFGCSECMAFLVDPSEEVLEGYYDDEETRDLGMMFHSYRLPNDKDHNRYAFYTNITMEHGIIRYPEQNKCDIKRKVVKEIPVKPEYHLDPIQRESNELKYRIIPADK